MIIPTGIGAVLYNKSTKKYAIRLASSVSTTWEYDSQYFYDFQIQKEVNDVPEAWVIKSEGYEPVLDEPKELGAIVFRPKDGRRYVRWAENENEVDSWIDTKNGLLLRWETLLRDEIKPFV